MKTIRLLLTLLLAAPVLAEDKPSPIAAVAGTKPLGALKSPIEITSRSSEVNLRSNVVVYVGNVRVTEANMSLTSEFLVAVMPQRGGRIERVRATNVVINMTDEQGQKIKGGAEAALHLSRRGLANQRGRRVKERQPPSWKPRRAAREPM